MTRTKEQQFEFLRHAIGKGTLCLAKHVGEPMFKWHGHDVCVHHAHGIQGYWIKFDGIEYTYNSHIKELIRVPKSQTHYSDD